MRDVFMATSWICIALWLVTIALLVGDVNAVSSSLGTTGRNGLFRGSSVITVMPNASNSSQLSNVKFIDKMVHDANNPPPEIPSFLSRYSHRLIRNTHRLLRGTVNLVPTMLENWRINRLRKQSGNAAISFTEYKMAEDSNDDVYKIGLNAARAYFMTSRTNYLFFRWLMPLLSSSPWTWDHLPYSYNNMPFDQSFRDRVLVQRRKSYLLSTFVQSNREAIERNLNNAAEDDVYFENYCGRHVNHLASATATAKARNSFGNLSDISRAMQFCSSNLHKTTSLLSQLYETSSRNAHQLVIDYSRLSHRVIRDISMCIGGDGVPAFIPLLRRLNARKISNHVQKLKDSDEFINSVGINSLNNDEVPRACHDRCIDPENATPYQLRHRLSEWLSIALDSPSISSNNTSKPATSSSNQVVNVHNRRLVLMALEVAKDLSPRDDWSGKVGSFFNRGTDGAVSVLKGMLGNKADKWDNY